jgi:hypothetical protein
MTKTYQHESVVYRFSPQNRAWTFDHTNPATGHQFTFIRSFSGRSETAGRIAKLIHGSFERKGELDNPTRANINRLVEAVEIPAGA